MGTLRATAQARVGLLGNPSDLYGGYGLGFAVAGMGAEVTLEASSRVQQDGELLNAGWRVAGAELVARGVDPDAKPFAARIRCDVPYQAGLSGSSAILVAAVRAWGLWYDAEIEPVRVAELAWRTEVEELGIRAGPLDRLVQACGGLLAMDFAAPFDPASIEPMDPNLLPPLLLAWHGEPTSSSGDVHAPVFARFEAGEAEVRETMAQLAEGARRGKQALERGDSEAFRACVDTNFALREQLFQIDANDRRLVELGRARGAAAKFPGSGGSVLFACIDEAQLAELESACRAAGARTLRPEVA